MNYNHLIPEPIIIDNFLSVKDSQRIWDEITNRVAELKHWDSNIDYTNWRLSLDDKRTIMNSDILDIFDKIWTSPKVIHALEANYNYCTQMLLSADTDVTYIKIEGEGDVCGWHKNDWARFPGMLTLVNWIWYLDYNHNYEGGELDYSFENIRQQSGNWSPIKPIKQFKTIKNEHNRFVLFPSFFWHRVRPIKFNFYEGPLWGRMGINGHVGFKLVNQKPMMYDGYDYNKLDPEIHDVKEYRLHGTRFV